MGMASTTQLTKLPRTIVLLKLVKGRTGVLVQLVHSGRRDDAVSRLRPPVSKGGTSRNPPGTNRAHPSMPPPNDTLSNTSTEKIARLCKFISGVSPSADPRAIPAA